MRRAFQRSLQKQGMKFKLGTKVSPHLSPARSDVRVGESCQTGKAKRSKYVEHCFCAFGMINNPAPVAHLQVASAEATTDGVNLALQPSKGNASTELMSADVVLVSTGMSACMEDILKDAAY